MTCPICGKQLPCSHVGSAAALIEEYDQVPREASVSESETSADGQWRREVASRVHQHRARRGRDSDAEQAMAFDFSAEEALIVTDGPVVRERVRRRFESDTLMAANGAPEQGFTSPEPPKIIRFPRSVRMLPDVPVTTPPLASEVTLTNMESSPRIVDVEEEQVPTNGQDIGMVQPERLVEPVRPAEQMELLPSFADITLESAHHRESTESEVIPRPAALSQRVIAGAIDVATVVMAAILFNFAFVRMAEDDPHSRLALLFGLCVAGTLWTLFQYLFLVHGRGTPGKIGRAHV